MRPHGPWRIRESREIYRDPWLVVVRDEVLRPDGQPGSYCVAHVKSGITVLAVDDNQQVYLTEEFHYAVGRVTLEAVSGGADEGEDYLQAAQRELKEELGIEAAEWIDLGRVDPFTSGVLSPTQVFLARRLTFGEPAPEGSEQIRMVSMPLAEAVDRVMTAGITHGASCIALLKAERLLRQETTKPAS
jgi:ADP-ribose pyrophosphatase